VCEALACGSRGRGGVSALGPGRREVGYIISCTGLGRAIPVRCWEVTLRWTLGRTTSPRRAAARSPVCSEAGQCVGGGRTSRAALSGAAAGAATTWRAPTHRWPARSQATPSKGRVRVTAAASMVSSAQRSGFRARWCGGLALDPAGPGRGAERCSSHHCTTRHLHLLAAPAGAAP